MGSKAIQYSVFSAGVMLLITALAKLISGFGNASVLDLPDPLLGMSFRYVFWVGGAIELAVCVICLCSRKVALRAGLLAWLATGFVVYRVGLVWIGYQKPCPCLGNLTSALQIPQESADNILKVVLVYLLLVGYGTLFSLWKERRDGLGTAT